MNSLNSNFLKLLFVIVILILIYKSYLYHCKEPFIDVNLFYYKKANGSNNDHIISSQDNKIVALLKNIDIIQINNDEIKINNQSEDQLVLTNLDTNSISTFLHLKFDIKINNLSNKNVLIMYAVLEKDIKKNAFVIMINNRTLTLSFINPTNQNLSKITLDLEIGKFKTIDLRIEDNKVIFNMKEILLDFVFNIKYIFFGKNKGSVSESIPFTLKNIKYNSYSLSDKIGILDSNKKPRAIWNHVYYFKRFFRVKEEDETPKTMLKLAYLNGTTSNIQILNLSNKKFTIQFFFKIMNTNKNPVLISSPSGTWMIQIVGGRIIFTINGQQYFPQPKNILHNNEFKIENDTLYNFSLLIGFNDIKIKLNKNSFTIKYRDSENVIKKNNQKIRDYFDTFFKNKNLLKDVAKEKIDEMFVNNEVNWDKISEITTDLKDFNFNQFMDEIDNSDINKVLETKEIIFGGELLPNNDRFIKKATAMNGYIGLIVYYKTFVSDKTLCQLDTCVDKEEFKNTGNLESYLNNKYTPTNFKQKYLEIKEDKLVLSDKYRGKYGEQSTIMNLPKKIELIVKADEKNISLFWQAPEQKNNLSKYVIIMQEKNKNSLDMDRQILVDTKELLYKNFPYIYNKFEIEKSAGSQSIDTNNYYINNFDILGFGTDAEVMLTKIESQVVDPNNLFDLKFKLHVKIIDGRGFKSGDRIKISNTDEIIVKNEDIVENNKWSSFKLFFPKNESCSLCEYVFKKLSPHKKYRFSILTVAKNKNIDFNYIGENEFIEAELKTDLQKDIDILGEKTTKLKRAVCNPDGTHSVYNFGDSYDYRCKKNVKSNIGDDHAILMDYLKPNDSIDIHGDVNLTM